MQIKLVSFLRLIVSSCMAELDLFKLICKTLIFLLCSRDSGIVDKGTAVDNCPEKMYAVDAEVQKYLCYLFVRIRKIKDAT